MGHKGKIADSDHRSMRRRSHLVIAFVALAAIGWNVVTTQPSGSALAADPQAELQRTRAQLADARSAQQALSATLQKQRSELASLQRRSADLDSALDLARAELAAVTAEYDRVRGLLAQVKEQVTAIERTLVELNAQIRELSRQLEHIAAAIERRTQDLIEREALLEDHLRSAYERSQTSMLEVLLSADSLDEVTREFGYLTTVSDQDAILADEIRAIREELGTRRETLREGRRVLADARALARDEEARLKARRAELRMLGTELAALRDAAAVRRAEQEAALNASLEAEGDVERKIADNERAARAAADLAAQLQRQAAAQQAAIEEARRRAAEEARRAAAAAAAVKRPSAYGFLWPERSFQVTQEWGPTTFQLEPPYTYKGTYYPHFHAGIDFMAGCGTPIYAAGPGVVVASGQPLMPWDTGFGVVVDHGDGIQTWYWHMQPGVVVSPGTIVTSNSVIGYEGSTGMSTGCHVHFAVNHAGWWENPRNYLP
jgi:murein DD-endopeptidase MepM/ murein hydrolase activator NlpD